MSTSQAICVRWSGSNWTSVSSREDCCPKPASSSISWTTIRRFRFVTMKRRSLGESSYRSCRSGARAACRWSIIPPGQAVRWRSEFAHSQKTIRQSSFIGC
jgi:hypothetical protein